MKILHEALTQLVLACAVPGLPSDLIEAVIMTESAGYAYAVSGSYEYSDYHLLPDSRDTKHYAIALSEASLQHNVNISIGLMQVNSWHIRRMGASVSTVIDPCNNVLIGSSILKEITDRVCGQSMTPECIDASLRQYNTGRTAPSKAGEAYVEKVRRHL